MATGFFERVYRLVRQVPPGKVTSYGAIARMLGYPHGARTVGWALHSLPPSIPPASGGEEEGDLPPAGGREERWAVPPAGGGEEEGDLPPTSGGEEGGAVPPAGRGEEPENAARSAGQRVPPAGGGDERGGKWEDVPWHRVINSQGRISTKCREHGANVQRELLEAEGIEFDERGTIDWDRFGWEGLTWPEIDDLMRDAEMSSNTR